MDPRAFSFEESTRDGAPVYIRAIRPDDRDRLAAFHRRLSPESVYFRFFEIKQELSPQDLSYLTELDFDRRVALVATLARDREAPLVGVARYDVLPADPKRAELGIIVEDAYQGKGIGTQLLKHLLGIAFSQGVREITAEVLPQNTKMLELVSNSGVPVRRRLEEGMIQLRL